MSEPNIGAEGAASLNSSGISDPDSSSDTNADMQDSAFPPEVAAQVAAIEAQLTENPEDPILLLAYGRLLCRFADKELQQASRSRRTKVVRFCLLFPCILAFVAGLEPSVRGLLLSNSVSQHILWSSTYFLNASRRSRVNSFLVA